MIFTPSVVIHNILVDGQYADTVLPFTNKDYFEGEQHKIVKTILDYYEKYNKPPSYSNILLEREGDGDIIDELGDIQDLNSELILTEDSRDYLIDKTEEFYRDRATYNALIEAVEIQKDSPEKLDSIPFLLEEAVSTHFNVDVGHSYFSDCEERFKYYQKKEFLLPTGLHSLDKSLGGGFELKTLNVLLAGTNVGKTLVKTALAANYMMAGIDCLYVTLEMSPEKISQRVDSNLLDIPINKVNQVDSDVFNKKVNALKSKTLGNLIVKEYPAASANTNHIRFLLRELKIKKGFTPKVLFLDYLNLLLSARKNDGNTYIVAKNVAEEIRGIAQEFNLCVITSTQTNRGGYGNSEVQLTDTSESFGVPATADWMGAIVRTKELDNMGQIIISQLKSRSSDTATTGSIVLGIDRSKMQLYDINECEQTLPSSEFRVEEHNVRPTEKSKQRFNKIKV